MFKFFVIGLLLAGCAHIEHKAIYFADTANKHKCDPRVFSEELINSMLHPSQDSLKKAEESSGYSDCVATNPDSNSMLWSCKKPIPYMSFSTTKLAHCHKFMNDNNLKQ